MESFQAILLKEFTDEAERELSVCDSRDMKANVLLVVITFLAAQTAYFLSVAASPFLRYAQIFSGLLLAVCGALTLAELFPREYLTYHPSNGAIEKKLAHLRKEHEGKEDQVIRHLTEQQIEWARERAKKKQEYKSLQISVA